MSDPITRPATPSLQFDRAVTAQGARESGVACSQCGKPILDTYFTLAHKPYCANCRLSLDRAIAATRSPKAFGKAFAYGLGAAIAGAAVYYAVLAILDLQIGIVAILIGYMVGYAIRKATALGARRYQILAASLTYFAIGLAYMPFALKGATDGAKKGATATHAAVRDTTDSAAVTDSAAASAASTAEQTPTKSVADSRRATKDAPTGGAYALAFIAAAGLAMALPVIVILGSLPGSLISAIIIGIGLRQAWRMTAAGDLTFVGPLRISPTVNTP